MNFELLETEIVSRLANTIPDINLKIFKIPEFDADQQAKIPWKEKWIVVGVTMEKEEDKSSGISEDVFAVIQHPVVTISLLLISKTIYGSDGIYDMLRKIQRSLVGFLPSDGEKMRYRSFEFVKNDAGVFEYSVDFSTRSTVMEEVEEIAGPPFEGLEFP